MRTQMNTLEKNRDAIDDLVEELVGLRKERKTRREAKKVKKAKKQKIAVSPPRKRLEVDNIYTDTGDSDYHTDTSVLQVD